MLPVTRGAIARMDRSLSDKQRAAKPGHPLARTPSRNRPALGASSNEGGGDSGAQSNRVGWLGKVWKGQRALPFRCTASDRDAVGGGPCPRRDRTQISEAPQAVESLHKCALDLFGLRVTA